MHIILTIIKHKIVPPIKFKPHILFIYLFFSIAMKIHINKIIRDVITIIYCVYEAFPHLKLFHH